MTNLLQEIIKEIDVVAFWKNEFPEWDGMDNGRVLCPFHDDTNPSLCISWTGKAVCSCGFRCTSVVGFYTDRHCNGNFKLALRRLYSQYVQKTFDKATIAHWHEGLVSNRKLIQGLMRYRGWTLDTIKRFGLGWAPKNKRIAIPVLNHVGYCVDIRWHDSFNQHKGKNGKRIPVLAHSKASKNQAWFPFLKDYNPFDSQELWLFEGEPDTIFAVQEGLNALTVTGGAGAWRNLPYDKLKQFEGKDIIICLDNDTTGKSAADELARRLLSVSVASIRVIFVPGGKDFTDYLMMHGGSVKALRALAYSTRYLYKSPSKDVRAVPLSATGSSEAAGKWIRSDVLVSGRSAAPFLIPERLKFSCRVGDRGYCATCPCSETGHGEMTVTVEEDTILDWCFTNDRERLIRHLHACDRRGRVDMDVEQYQAVQRVMLVPALHRNQSDGEYCSRVGFAIGRELNANEQYQITAKPIPHPRTRDAVLVISNATPSRDSIQDFKLSNLEADEIRGWMKDLERLPLEPKVAVMHKVRFISQILATSATRIVGRWLVHAAVDLCLHSPLNLEFAGVRLPKGTIELLLFGDTRTGKGTIVEGMFGYYDVGVVVNGENTSLMGLLGGALKLPEGGHALSWGALPLNNGRVVAIDEFSGLKEDVLGNLSRVRSEGIAEMHKAGIHDSTAANVRTIWMANPRKGVEVAHFGFGVEGIMDLVRTQEDVARFDLACVLAKKDVEAAAINKVIDSPVNEGVRDVLRRILRWAWSRTPAQIRFTKEATSAILVGALHLSDIFSAAIPLVQAENIRFKIAKIAAAMALRCFSTDDNETCIVRKEHAMAAIMFLKLNYRQPTVGYLAFSEAERQLRAVDIDALKTQFELLKPEDKRVLVTGLLGIDKFRAQNITDWLSVDSAVARSFIGIWVRCGAIEPLADGAYRKRARFSAWLQKQKR